MGKPIRELLTSDAPPWAHAAFFSLVPGLLAFMLAWLSAAVVLPHAREDSATPIALAVAVLVIVWYARMATPRVSVLHEYAAALAERGGESPSKARERVWSWGGPAWRTLGLTPVLALSTLFIPVSLVVVLSFRNLSIGSSDALSTASPTQTLIVVVIFALVVWTGWLVSRAMRRSHLAELLIAAARQPGGREELIAAALDLAERADSHSVAFWVGSALLAAWGGSIGFGNAADAIGLSGHALLATWIVLSSAIAAFGVRGVRQRGAPKAVWLGVGLYPLLSALLVLLINAGFWDAFGPLMSEADVDPWAPPGEFALMLGRDLLADIPMVVAAWLAAVRTTSERSETPTAEPAD